MYTFKKILARLAQRYSLDLRALALLRISIALVIIADLCIRFSDLTAFYTNDGIWPTELVHSFGWKPGFWSLHALSGTYTWQLVLFLIHFVAAVFLLLGYRTKLMTVLVWILTISLHNRNVFILQAGDDLLRLVLFWGLFLPWNRRYSIDARQKPLSAKQHPAANFGYLLLLACVYFFTIILKSSTEWRHEGSAVYYALSLEQMRLPLGDWLYNFPGLMKGLTYLVFYIELIIPFLILFPSKKGNLRFIAFLLIVLLQLGIGSTLYVGLFFIINITAAVALIPTESMNKLEMLLRVKRQKLYGSSEPIPFKIIRNSICSLAIIFCLFINLSAFSWFDYELRKEVSYTTNAFRFNQYWGMFSPGVLKKDGWFVYYGADSIGRQWDLRKNQDYVDFSKPAHIVDQYKNDRWRKLAENLQNDNFTFLRPLFGKYILHQWNLKHPERKMSSLTLYFMEKENLPDYKTIVSKKLFFVCNE